MAYVYILRSLKTGTYYIGSTIDLVKRIKSHNSGVGSVYTRRLRPWELICYRLCDSEREARDCEKLVKSYKSGEGFKKIINGELAEWSKAPHC